MFHLTKLHYKWIIQVAVDFQARDTASLGCGFAHWLPGPYRGFAPKNESVFIGKLLIRPPSPLCTFPGIEIYHYYFRWNLLILSLPDGRGSVKFMCHNMETGKTFRLDPPTYNLPGVYCVTHR